MTEPFSGKIAPPEPSGILLFDKGSGISSNAAVQRVRRLFRARKVGHTGTLDPAATGLLPMCFGEAAKFICHLPDGDKKYVAVVKFGVGTNTGDAEGEITARCEHIPDEESLRRACAAFVGDIRQIPPMYSALKHHGRALYDYARRGIDIERPARTVHVSRISLLAFDRESASATVEVVCGKGTYIRTLAEDIARKAGSLAHLVALRRTATSGFAVANAFDFADLSSRAESELPSLLLPCDAGLTELPALTLSDAAVLALRQGKKVQGFENEGTIRPFRIYDVEKRFVGLAQNLSGSLKAQRLMNPAFVR